MLRTPSTRCRDLDSVVHLLETKGAVAALQFLNAGVPHRYSGVYRVEGDRLRNVLFFDKEGLARPEMLEVVPIDQSYCQYVVRDGLFRTNNAGLDPRLQGHPFSGFVLCYHAVPLRDPDRTLIGTLSHFDLVPHSIADDEFELLYLSGHVLSEFVPP